MCAKVWLPYLFAAVFLFAPRLVVADAPDLPALQERAEQIELLIASLQEELANVRVQIAKLPGRKGVTPQQGVEQYKMFPTVPVTVEFGVEPIGYPDAPTRLGDDPEPAIWARWDNRLVGGGTLTAIVPPAVYRKLSIPTAEGGRKALEIGRERAEVVRHIETHGIRVTGLLKPGGFQGEDYTIEVTDPANVVLYIKGSGQ